ncbi:unnamed protein product [Bacillus thuringiensis DB27]|uniref:Uncharacterized protein n=1 Tax=Bacillus thuringiensis DB27 TaxID=1431339 RepID=W8YMI2_BACTU|nr:unnamed protein product [Bacillus thuringiensis DB27]
MPINLKIQTAFKNQKMLFFLKSELERVPFFMNLWIQDKLQLFSEEFFRHLIPCLLKEP